MGEPLVLRRRVLRRRRISRISRMLRMLRWWWWCQKWSKDSRFCQLIKDSANVKNKTRQGSGMDGVRMGWGWEGGSGI
jgi:hypothetical protein